MLRFYCPSENKKFDTGIYMDGETYTRQRLRIIAVMCPHCERKHRFLVADAEFLTEEVAA